jgi:hypothetical protein
MTKPDVRGQKALDFSPQIQCKGESTLDPTHHIVRKHPKFSFML